MAQERKATRWQPGRQAEALLDALGDLVLVHDLAGRMLDANQTACRRLGYSRRELRACSLGDVDHPGRERSVPARIEETFRRGAMVFETVYVARDGREVPVEVNSRLIECEGEPAVLNVARAIADRKETDKALHQRAEELAVLNRLGRHVGASPSPVEVAEAVLEEVAASLQPDLALLYLCEQGELHLRAARPESPAFGQVGLEVRQFGQCLCGLAAAQAKCVYSRDIRSDGRCTLAPCRDAGIRSFAALPLMQRDELLGVLSLASFRERDFAAEAPFLETLAGQVAVGLHNALLYERAQGHAAELERRLAELRRAEDALRREHSFREGIIRHAAEGLCVCHGKPESPFIEFTVWNDRMTEITGYTMAEINRLGWYQAMYPDPHRQRRARERIDRMRGGDDLRGEEWQITRADGRERTVSISTSAVESQDGTTHILALMDDVTGRKRAETALRESERFLQSVFDGIQDGISVLDAELTVLRVNRWMERMYAHRAPLVGRKCYDVYQCRGSPCPGCPSVKALRTGKAHRETVPYRTADGSAGWIELSAFPLLDDEGAVVGIIEHVKDITDRRRAAEALRRERDLLERITETSPAGIVLMDRDGRITFANPGAEEILGLNRSEITRRTFGDGAWDLTDFDGEPLPAEETAFRKAQAAGQAVYDVRCAVRRADGRRVLVSVNAAPLFDAQGEFDGVVATITDVTRRVQAEEERRASERRYRELYESSRDGYAAVDLDGAIIACNSAFREIIGYSEAELRRKSYRDITPERWHAEEARVIEEQVFRRGYSDVYEKEYLRKDGTVVPIEIRTYLLTGPAGKPTGMWAFVRDITERRQLEEQLRQAQKMEAVGRLAGGIAHDFNNQLTVVKGYCDLLLAAEPAASPRRDELEEIRDACRRAQRLPSQLLAFSRKQVLRPEVSDLNAILQEMRDPVGRMIGEDIQMSIVADRNLGNVRIDRSQFQQAVMNLVVNARDAMPRGGRLTIQTANVDLDEEFVRQHAEVSPGAHVLLTVSDTGRGMDAETRRRIFEPFFTTKPVGKGTGLGLSMVYGFVRQSSGSIYVYSEKGTGTTVRIYLPRVSEPVAAVEEEEAAEEVPGGTETVLVVEDDESVRHLVTRALRKEGYAVLDAGGAPEALRLAEDRDGPIHLLATDVVMPGMNGRELAERLHAVRPELKVLYLSGYTQEAIASHGVLERGVDLLPKPFTLAELAKAVRRALDRPPEPPDRTA